MTRAIIIVLDSVGCGGAEDASAYGDEGANTLLHIAQACAEGQATERGVRQGPLTLPRLGLLGLGLAVEASCGVFPPGLAKPADAAGLWGYGVETAAGKDTPSGHWEIAGAKPDFAWGYFPDTVPAFPDWLTSALVARGRAARHSRRQARLRHRHHRRARRGACADGQADLLHLGRQRAADRGA